MARPDAAFRFAGSFRGWKTTNAGRNETLLALHFGLLYEHKSTEEAIHIHGDILHRLQSDTEPTLQGLHATWMVPPLYSILRSLPEVQSAAPQLSQNKFK